MNASLLVAERLVMALVLGGGSVLAMAFRPLALQGQEPGSPAEVANAVERISVGTWTRFNRLSLGATLLALAAEAVTSALGAPAYTRLYIAALMAVALLIKLQVDARLRRQAESGLTTGLQGGADRSLDRQHCVVEMLSGPILIGALLLLTVRA